ncbi:beta-N-acetylhexosaminidase [Pendulispora brunnea]|uniref:beta-N-acetylhexosaminidase n=1 Tax=Pendulispora brunnea TaxID=2905690 RepID=A0ABZ2KCY2_9BACT
MATTPRAFSVSLCVLAAVAATASCSPGADTDMNSEANEEKDSVEALAAAIGLDKVIPSPVSVQSKSGQDYTLTQNTVVYADPNSPEAGRVGEYLAGLLRPATGYPFTVRPANGTPNSGIALLLSGANNSVGASGYEIDVTSARVLVRAKTGAGLFAAVQTLRQLLPVAIESSTVENASWKIAGGHILDYPRLDYRGGMLDVARHFFPVATVKRYIDHLARYKLNYFHIHLADDQGWRIQIDSYPRLATYGGSTQVGGGPGGYYTKAEYTDIVNYAAARYITVVPEIDMPGHTNAALASVPALNCNNQAPPLYTGTDVGFSSFCMDAAHRDIVTKFVDDVVRELAALTPGPYIHLGGDEAQSTQEADYIAFEKRVFPIVAKYGKRMVGWHEILKATPDTTALPQYWGTTPDDANVKAAAQRGMKFLVSAANKTYLDMKYNPNTPLGQDWAGLIEVRDAYDWNPGAYLTGVPSSQIAGFEAPLWTETITKLSDIEYMIFPRLPALAERGWSPASRTWSDFRTRLATHGPRWKKAKITYYPSSQIAWP